MLQGEGLEPGKNTSPEVEDMDSISASMEAAIDHIAMAAECGTPGQVEPASSPAANGVNIPAVGGGSRADGRASLQPKTPAGEISGHFRPEDPVGTQDSVSSLSVGIPPEQSSVWGDCNMGQLDADCPAMGFIRRLEGSQQESSAEVPVVSLGACIVVGEYVNNGSVPQQSQGDQVGIVSTMEVPVVGEKVPQVVSPCVTSGGPPTLPFPPRSITTSQEVSLIGALREGRSFAQVAGGQCSPGLRIQ